MLLVAVSWMNFNAHSMSSTDIKIPVYMLSTKNNSNLTGLVGQGYGNYSLLNISDLKKLCPPEVVFFVHGWGDNEYMAKERLDRVKLSLEFNKYNTSLVGLSWNPSINWTVAKNEAKDNGPKLAEFIVGLKGACKNTDIRLLAHSLGSRVVLSTLDALHNNSLWEKNGFKIASVNLMGAAVDDEEVSKNPKDIDDEKLYDATLKFAYGQVIEDEVKSFYNLYDSEDNMLQPHPFPIIDMNYSIYPNAEKDTALGQVPYQMSPKITLPINFEPINVTNEIKAIYDSDLLNNTDIGLCYNETNHTQCKVSVGDNHGGYIGFRNPDNGNSIIDDGAMDKVVATWRPK